jgi:hypothetical protein
MTPGPTERMGFGGPVGEEDADNDCRELKLGSPVLETLPLRTSIASTD